MDDGAQDAERGEDDREDGVDRPRAASEAREAAGSRVHGSEEYKFTGLIRRQHRRNLLAIMRHAMLTSDYITAAGAIGTLLACMPEGAHLGGFGPDVAEQRDSMLELIWSMLEVLRQHNTPPEQLKRCLTKVAALMKHQPSMRQVTQLEIILGHWTKNKVELRRCLDLIKDEVGKKHLLALSRPSSRSFLYHLSALEGFIRHNSWMDQLQNASSTRALSSQFASQFSSQASVISSSDASSTAQAELNQQLLGPLQLGPFAPRDDMLIIDTQPTPGLTQASVGFSQIGLGGTQMSQGLTQPSTGGSDELEASKRALRRALDQVPAALLPALLLCHTLMLTDQQDEAAEVAAAAVNASGRSPEALSLLAVVKEHAATQAVTGAYSRRQITTDSHKLSQHTAAVRASQAASSANAAADDGDVDDEHSIHSYVDVCCEILQSDPWQQGAVQGLLQMCGHCHKCQANTIRGLLMHITAAAAAASSHVSGDGSVNASLDALWGVLSVLIMQLAVQVALDAAAQTAALIQTAARPPPSAEAADHVQDPMDTDEPPQPGRGAAAAAAATNASAAPAVTVAQELWEQLQESFRSVQFWWNMAGGVADVGELCVLWPQEPQDTQQQQQQIEQQKEQQQGTQQTVGAADNAGLHSSHGRSSEHGIAVLNAAAALTTVAAAVVDNEDQGEGELVLLRGSGSDTSSQDSQNTSNGDTVDDSGTAAAAAAHRTTPATAAENENDKNTVVTSNWGAEHQMLCSKAVALLFILGPENEYSLQAAEAVEAAAAAAAALSDAGDYSRVPSSRDESSGMTLTLARDALDDAFIVAHQTNQWLELRRQQKLQELVNQQQQQQQLATKRLLGPPSDLFGGMLDLPESWWHCFPQRRRPQQQQLQQLSS